METSLLKRFVVGAPMPLSQARHERLSKRVALAVFASDALSSTAYATEEILRVLVLAGSAPGSSARHGRSPCCGGSATPAPTSAAPRTPS